MNEQYQATPEQWARLERGAMQKAEWNAALVVLELRDRLAAAEQRISELESNYAAKSNSSAPTIEPYAGNMVSSGSLVDDASMGDLEFLTAIKNYIEEAEKTMDDEWGHCRSIEELIKAGLMPQPIYSKVVQRINALQPRSSGTHQ